ncbi:fibronectin type III-like domain-contianing protein [Streptomyces mirabilis]|nr:fibronectin type III-like domain-contianing protein [Streptomyces mirabilis]
MRWLVGSAPVHVPAGRTAEVGVTVSTRYLAHWAGGWAYEPGAYLLRVGTSVADLPLETALVVSE